MAVDFARRPYSTDCRFHKDSDQVVKIRWYPALPSAGTLPFPSSIASLDWSSRPWIEGGIGEVWNRPRTYNGAVALPYATGLAPCQPAQVFAEGEELDEDADDQEYNEDGFPLCCLNNAVPKGGLEFGGAALVPSTLCETPNPVALGQWHTWTIPIGPFDTYFSFEGLPNGADYRLRAEVLSTNGAPFWLAGFSHGSPCVGWSGAFINALNLTLDTTRTLDAPDTRIALGSDSVGTAVVTFRFRVDPV